MDFHTLFKEFIGKNSFIMESCEGVEPKTVRCGGDIIKSHGKFSK